MTGFENLSGLALKVSEKLNSIKSKITIRG